MATNVYYKGTLISIEDWDYETSRPVDKPVEKKKVSKKEPDEVIVELPPEVQPVTEE